MLPARRLPEQAALFDRAEVRPVTPDPDLTAYDVILANLSGGKDSQTMLRVLVAAADAAGVRDRIVCVFADLGEADEWPGAAEMAAAHAAAYGLRIITVRREITDPRTGRREPQGLLERIVRRGMWPDARNRYCTSDLKRGPIRTVMTFLADEARARGITGRRVRILNVLGMRAQESPSRRLMAPFAPDAGSSNKTRREVDQWLPIHTWTLDEVWADIRASGVPYHRVYDYGMPRLSCRFCLAGETEVVTRDGLRPIRELAGGRHPLLVPVQSAAGITGRGSFTDVEVRSFGVQPLFRVTMHRGRQHKTIYTTSEHRWLVFENKAMPRRSDGRRDGYTRVTGERTTQQLTPGTELRSLKARWVTKTDMVRFAIAQGFVYGDGTLGGGERPAVLHIYDREKDGAILPFFEGHKVTPGTSKGKPVSTIRGLPRLWKSRPDLRESRAFLVSWLAGYFAADGCVTTDGSASISSSSPRSIRVIRDVAAICGVGYGPVQTVEREGFPGRPKSALHKMTLDITDLPDWFFIIEEHQARIAARRQGQGGRQRHWVIDSVISAGRTEEVFCAVVPGVQAFGLSEDLMTGNCILASESALVLAAQLDPAGAEARAAVEREFLRRKLVAVLAVMLAAAAEGRLTPLLALALRRALRSGHKFQAARSMEEVIAKAKALPRPAVVDDWQG